MKPETRTYYETAVLRAVERVVGALDEALDLQALARGAALSPFHFHRVFRGLVGETPLELHRRLRLERAAEQLGAGARPITQIAFDAGYETHESFTRAFRTCYGVAPSAFRERAGDAAHACHGGSPIELASRSRLHVRSGHDLTTLILTTGRRQYGCYHRDLARPPPRDGSTCRPLRTGRSSIPPPRDHRPRRLACTSTSIHA